MDFKSLTDMLHCTLTLLPSEMAQFVKRWDVMLGPIYYLLNLLQTSVEKLEDMKKKRPELT